MEFDHLQGPVSGLAHALDQPSPSLAQNPASALFPRNNSRATSISEKQRAINILQDQRDDAIFAYLKIARSLDQSVNYFPGHGSLSSDEITAVWTLRDCADDEIRTWLEQARKPSSHSEEPNYSWGDRLHDLGFVYLSSSGQARDNLHAFGGSASVCAPRNVVRIEGSDQSTLNFSRDRPQQTLDKTGTSYEATNAANFYWCTQCDDRRRYKNVSDWRKHEKEHVDTYVCMLRGPLEKTEGGLKCTLCGTSNPSKEHLSAHKIQKCGQEVPGSFVRKRRTDLVKHLRKDHLVPGKAQGEAIADKCKKTTNKQAWSCGFCVYLVHTFGDRLKHIATHFERGQTIDEWDTTKVMEGLLSQPGMISVWQLQLAASPMGWESSEFIWKKDVVQNLQRALEVGPANAEHAVALAKAAYEARQPGRGLVQSSMPLATAPNSRALGQNAIVPTSNYDSITGRTIERNSNQHQSRFVANPAQTLHYSVPGLDDIPMASYGSGTFPASSSDDGGSTAQAPWLSNPGQTWSSPVGQYIDPNEYQEHGNAGTGNHIWPTPPVFSSELDTDDMLE